ncbi:MAG: Calcium-independent phospholipase A2-gamma [Marteilia pararefringens]
MSGRREQQLINEVRTLRCNLIRSRGNMIDEKQRRRVDYLISSIKSPSFSRIVESFEKVKNFRNTSEAIPVATNHCLRKEIELLKDVKIMLNSNNIKKKVNVLAIDGGGSRGLIALKILQAIERYTKKSIVDIFDVVYGVSTGAIIIALLFTMNLTIDDVIDKYQILNKQIWQRNSFVGFYSLLQKSAYYNSEFLFHHVNEIFQHNYMVNTQSHNHTRIGVVSIKCKNNITKPYIFRNWVAQNSNFGPYDGSNLEKWIDAIKSTTAAPIIYEPHEINGCEYIDGGIFANNPSFIAYKEMQHFFPNYRIQNFLSVGTGKFDPLMKEDSFRAIEKHRPHFQKMIERIIQCATNVENVHQFMDRLLPPKTYFRLNPRIPYQFSLNESRSESLMKMMAKSDDYIEENVALFEKIGKCLK